MRVCVCVYKEAGEGFERATCPPFHLEPVTVANFVPRPNLYAVPFPRTNRAYDDRDRAKSFKYKAKRPNCFGHDRENVPCIRGSVI